MYLTSFVLGHPPAPPQAHFPAPKGAPGGDLAKVEISLKDQLSPGVVRGVDKGYCYVVMPMRI